MARFLKDGPCFCHSKLQICRAHVRMVQEDMVSFLRTMTKNKIFPHLFPIFFGLPSFFGMWTGTVYLINFNMSILLLQIGCTFDKNHQGPVGPQLLIW